MTKKPPPFTPFVRPREIESIRNDTRAGLINDDELAPIPAANEEEAEGVESWDEDDNDEALPDDEYEYDPRGAFIIRTGEDWQHDDQEIPESAMLFGQFWHQNELCILFADTNVGKSVLAVQIADSISRGQSIGHLQMDAPAVPVLYFDFELSDQQFRRRYSSPAEGKYPFTKNFCRATLNPFSDKQNRFKTYEEFINNEIENALLAYKAKVLIIDNITCLRYGTQSAAGAQNLMQYLQNIKLRYQISILVLAHTPKRNTTKPLSRNDLQGSKMLINFADSAFAIGESQQSPGLRYLKQIKQRNNAEAYGAANICTGTIAKPGNFLHFQFGSQGYETDHLTPYTEQYRKNTQTRIAQLNRQGQTIRQIATRLGLATTTVFRTLKRLGECADSECADMQMSGECADEGCADVQMSDECADEGCADMQIKAGPAAIPSPGRVQGGVMGDAYVPTNPLQTDQHTPNAIASKSAQSVILSLSKDDARKGPEDAHAPTNQECVMEDAEHPAPEVAIPPPNAPTLTPPPRSDTSMHITGNNFALYKQYQKEIAMLKADERANESRRKKAASTKKT